MDRVRRLLDYALEDEMGWLYVLAILAIVCIAGTIAFEITHPCVQYGEQVVTKRSCIKPNPAFCRKRQVTQTVCLARKDWDDPPPVAPR